MFAKYLLIFFVSMVPLVELRGSIVMAVGMDLDLSLIHISEPTRPY